MQMLIDMTNLAKTWDIFQAKVR